MDGIEILLICAILFCVGAISSYYNRKCSNNMGHNIGKKHLKDKWGIDEREEYHE